MKQNIYIILVAVLVFFTACRDNQWDEHSKLTFEGGDLDLLIAIQNMPELGNFYDAIVKTGYDNLLASANSFTVLAPVNSAWNSVDMNDVDGLRKIVANHIAYEKKLDTNPTLFESMLMVNGKYVRFNANNSFNNAQIVSAGHLAGNGVLHTIDNIVELRSNIWEYISELDYPQGKYIKTLNREVMDIHRSVQIAVDPSSGAPLYDTVWMNVNNFLNEIPLDDESKIFTYVLLREDGFNELYDKFKPYYLRTDEELTDLLLRFSLSSDFVFEGIRDIVAETANGDTMVNLFGMKVPLTGEITGPYNASNGRVYIVDNSNIRYREKIKPIHIEGEDYTGTNVSYFVIKRFRTWASGNYDVAFTFPSRQRDTVFNEFGEPYKHKLYNREPNWIADADSVVNIDFHFGTMEINFLNPQTMNGYIEYKAQVHSCNYRIHYVAYNDYASHVVNNPPRRMNLIQKLFVSMPDAPLLQHGRGSAPAPAASTRPADISSHDPQSQVWSGNAVLNNFLGPDTCFVAVDTAGIHKERIMTKHRLKFRDTYYDRNTSTSNDYRDYGLLRTTVRNSLPQLVDHKIQESGADELKVPRNGEMTMWLTNTTINTRNETDRWYGPLFLDYLRLEPILPYEE